MSLIINCREDNIYKFMVIDGCWRGVLLLQQFFNKENDKF